MSTEASRGKTLKSHLDRARSQRNDEFYTLYKDVEEELQHYTEHFRDAVIYLPCDDPRFSNFWKYLADNFENFGLRKLIATHYHPTEPVYRWELTKGSTVRIQKLEGNGDFRSEECKAITRSADLVITNPPFSLFRAFMDTLFDAGVTFLVLSPLLSVHYENIFEQLKQGKIKSTVRGSQNRQFTTTDGAEAKKIAVCFLTNLNLEERPSPKVLTMNYKGNEAKYPKFDRYDAINVGRIKDIPKDYLGIMGVPITFIHYLNPKQFEILWLDRRPWLKGRQIFSRVFIRRKDQPKESNCA